MSVPSIWSTEGAAKVGPGDAVSTSHDDGSIDHGVTQAPYERRFSPYDFNGGYVPCRRCLFFAVEIAGHVLRSLIIMSV